MILEIPRENIDKLLDNIKWESSDSIKNKVIRAWEVQKKRFAGTAITSNSDMSSKDIDTYIKLSWEVKSFLSDAAEKLVLSPRVVHRIIKLGRTIADMEGVDELSIKYLAEAMQYRSKTMFIEG